MAYIILGAIAVIAMGLVFGFAIKLLWNWLMPELFHLKEITYWQGIGIFILARLIFGFGGGSGNSEKNHKVIEVKEEIKGEVKESTKNWRDWEFYDKWWDEEGKKTFDSYVAQKRDEASN
jgi:hypothetical protein